ncbi:Glutaredoxin-C8 [Arthrobotrys entomopaga]|nr:Glutaredoxin-C8 [Arthrobotrys entomopaga]
MTALRRVKLLGVAALTLMIIFLWYGSQARSERREALHLHNEERYRQKEAHKHAAAAAGDGAVDPEDLAIEKQLKSQRLKDAEVAAKAKANAKAPNPPAGMEAAAAAKAKSGAGKKWDVHVEIDEFLAMSPSTIYDFPHLSHYAIFYLQWNIGFERWLTCDDVGGYLVIIFSKSYCPYSKKAKKLLLETYKITPAPFVIELDEHDHGSEIQDELEKMTGRRTVPNILVQGRSIGGSDDVAALEAEGQLVKKIRQYGGKNIQDMVKA